MTFIHLLMYLSCRASTDDAPASWSLCSSISEPTAAHAGLERAAKYVLGDLGIRRRLSSDDRQQAARISRSSGGGGEIQESSLAPVAQEWRR